MVEMSKTFVTLDDFVYEQASFEGEQHLLESINDINSTLNIPLKYSFVNSPVDFRRLSFERDQIVLVTNKILPI